MSQTALAEFSDDRPVHHFFNAHLLKPGEVQLSIAGNVKVGATENLEVGTNVFLLRGGNIDGYNLALKHRMFAGPRFETAFVSHSLLYFYDTGAIKARAFVSLHGIVTSWNVGRGATLNAGLYDLAVRYTDFAEDGGIRGHVVAPSLGGDWIITDKFALQASLVQALYSELVVTTDFGDIAGSWDENSEDLKRFRVGYLTLTWWSDQTNVELGSMLLGERGYLYANLFWRIYGG
jgi:hypothetical protein